MLITIYYIKIKLGEIMKLGLVGLPNVGKSTLFNAITKAGAECANYPFCTIEPNVGIVAVPDERLEVLGAMYNTKKITPAVVEFVDIAGLVKGASKGEGLGNKFLANIRETDAIVHVVRCFTDDNITHVDGNINPLRDIETIDVELQLADIESITKKLDKALSMVKTGDKKYAVESDLLKRLLDHIGNGNSARSFNYKSEEEELYVKNLFLLTAKPVIYALNIAESDIGKKDEDIPFVKEVIDFAKKEGSEYITISAKIEEDITKLEKDEQKMFLDDLGLTDSGLDRLIKASYRLLGLISYLTAGEKEVRAWTITEGTKAPQAAGKIHSDFEKGFIRAEIVDYDVLKELGSFNSAKEKGKVRSEGKDYVMKDGDVVLFRFNV